GPSDTVSVALGKGDGTFLAPQTFDVGINPNSVAVGDFNGDGTPDLAVATYDIHRFGPPGDVSVLLGNGDGTFQAQLTFPAGTTPFCGVAGGFSGDGTPGLAVLNPSGCDATVPVGVFG